METEMRRYWSRGQALKRWLQQVWPNSARRPPVHYVEHHLAHVGGSFLVSGFEEAALLGIDGSGEWATSLLGHGRGNQIEVFQHSWFPMSLGSFFEAVTDWCGFRPNYDEGKTMGLAPYGDASAFYDQVARLVRVESDGGIWLDLSYFNHQLHHWKRYSHKFVTAFGPPRKKDRDIPFETHHKDVAAAFQRVLEERVLEMCEILHRRTGAKKLVIAGGVALNSVMNGRIVREAPFEDMYVMPGAGDNGTCIGAAYYTYNTVLGGERNCVHDDPYLGTEYSDDVIRRTLEACGLALERHDDIEEVAAKLLAEGHIVGWFQGRMEFGPRALGSRTILANPTLPDMKAVLNARVKHREPFRPFAPACVRERATEFFDSTVETPFMLKVCNVLPQKRSALPAITHVDGTARLQTVDQRPAPAIPPAHQRVRQDHRCARGAQHIIQYHGRAHHRKSDSSDSVLLFHGNRRARPGKLRGAKTPWSGLVAQLSRVAVSASRSGPASRRFPGTAPHCPLRRLRGRCAPSEPAGAPAGDLRTGWLASTS